MFREISSLQTICLKVIGKSPGNCINESIYERLCSAYPLSLRDRVTQDLIDHITEAGRMSDFVIPVIAFTCERTNLSLKNSKISGPYLIEILKRCPNLTSLDVSGCLMVDDEIVLRVLLLCPHMKNIEIRNCRKLTDLTLEYLIQHGHLVCSINIGGNFNLTENGVINLVQSHPNRSNFISLNLSGLPISEHTLLSLANNCQSLKSVGIGYAIISETAVRQFLDICGPKLEYLCISWLTSPAGLIDGVSIDVIDYIAKTCPRLHTLDISGLKNITCAALVSLIEYKRTKADYYPQENEKLRHIVAKFTAGSRSQLEGISAQYSELVIEA